MNRTPPIPAMIIRLGNQWSKERVRIEDARPERERVRRFWAGHGPDGQEYTFHDMDVVEIIEEKKA